MNVEEFIRAYEKALGTQDWQMVKPLISEKASVTFSNGTVHHGRDDVQKAFEKNFSTIKSEKYLIENVKWLVKDQLYAVYLFDFSWTGIVNGDKVSGNGCGTTVIRKEGKSWKLLAEHLGRR